MSGAGLPRQAEGQGRIPPPGSEMVIHTYGTYIIHTYIYKYTQFILWNGESGMLCSQKDGARAGSFLQILQGQGSDLLHLQSILYVILPCRGGCLWVWPGGGVGRFSPGARAAKESPTQEDQ